MRLLCAAVSMTLGVALVGPPVGATKPKSKPHTAAAKRGASAHNAAADRDPAPCNLGARPKLFLFYAGVGGERAFKYLKGCHGEVVIGEKHEKPHHPFKSPAAQKAGGRTAYVMANFGNEIRDLLRPQDGVARAKKRVLQLLAAGYDYIVIDEITAHADWADGSTVNRRFRELLTHVPARKLIAYVSIDLTQYPGGGARMKARSKLLRALQLRGRALALEVYLHTAEVMRGAAPRVFAEAADRLANAVGGHNINRRAITVLGLTLDSTAGARYEYLNGTRADISSIHKQVEALRRGTARLQQQVGHGFYYSGLSHITPKAGGAYTIEQLLDTIGWSIRR